MQSRSLAMDSLVLRVEESKVIGYFTNQNKNYVIKQEKYLGLAFYTVYLTNKIPKNSVIFENNPIKNKREISNKDFCFNFENNTLTKINEEIPHNSKVDMGLSAADFTHKIYCGNYTLKIKGQISDNKFKVNKIIISYMLSESKDLITLTLVKNKNNTDVHFTINKDSSLLRNVSIPPEFKSNSGFITLNSINLSGLLVKAQSHKSNLDKLTDLFNSLSPSLKIFFNDGKMNFKISRR